MFAATEAHRQDLERLNIVGVASTCTSNYLKTKTAAAQPEIKQ